MCLRLLNRRQLYRPSVILKYPCWLLAHLQLYKNIPQQHNWLGVFGQDDKLCFGGTNADTSLQAESRYSHAIIINY